MRILVTGGAGAIGRATLPRLRRDGHVVVAPSRAELDVTADVRAAVAAAAVDVVVHLAGATSGDAAHLHAVNVGGTQRIVEAAEDIGARVVLASSAAVYGDRRGGSLREADAVEPLAPYGVSKVDAEAALRPGDAAVRIFNVHGGLPGSLVDRLLAATASAPVSLHGLDGFVRDYVHVAEVAEALARIVQAPAVRGPINVGTGVATSNRDLLAALGVPAAAAAVTGDARSRSVADVAALAAALDWTPTLRLQPDSDTPKPA